MNQHRWITIAQALDHVASKVGSQEEAQRQITERLVLGRIDAIAAYYADSRSQATWRLNVRLPPGRFPLFWRAARIEWHENVIVMDGEYRDLTGSLLEALDFPPRAEGGQLSEADVLREWAAVFPSDPPRLPTKKRGPEPRKLQRIVAEMQKLGLAELDRMPEEAMAATFGASRDTCRRARRMVLAGTVGISNSDK